MESREARVLEDARRRLVDLNEAIQKEQEAILEAKRRESQLSDEDAALKFMLAKSETELINRSIVVLHKAREEIRDRVDNHPEARRLQKSVEELTRFRDNLNNLLMEKAKPVCRMLRKLNDTTGTTFASCKQIVPENYDTVVQAVSHCESSGALILITADVAEIDVII